MIRQSQNLFAAAVSAALLNAAAVAAFVLFTVLSGVSGFPLRSVLGAVDSITSSPPSQSVDFTGSAGGASGDVLSHRGGLASAPTGSNPFSGSANNSKASTALTGPRPNLHQAGGGAQGGPVGPAGPGGAGSSGGAGGGAAGGGSGIPGTPSPTSPAPTLTAPPALGSALNQAAGAGATVNNAVAGVAGTASAVLGNGSSANSSGGSSLGSTAGALLGSPGNQAVSGANRAAAGLTGAAGVGAALPNAG